MKEIWKDVKGYEGLYKVSNAGKVYSIRNEKLIKPKKNNRDYIQIRLYKDKKVEHWLLHRLVATNFIENPNNLPQINHKDEDKNNNCVENLEWCTNLYNRHHGTGIERMAKNHDYEKISKLRCKRVNQYTLEGEYIRSWDSATEIQNETGKLGSSISACCRHEYKTSYGYKWEYADKH